MAKRRTGVRLFVAAMLATGSLLTAGCAQPIAVPNTPPASPTETSRDDRLVGSATVLDDGSGPELCLGAIFQSLPPQCGGPPLDGWRWPTAGVERVGGVTWGSFVVVGRYDGERFDAEKVITPEQAASSLPTPKDRDLASPCPEPAGGWRPVDADRSGADDQAAAFERAASLADYGGSWIDDRGNSAQPPETTVVNVRVTGDLGVAERRLRTVWGGPLCVSKAAHTDRELDRIQTALQDEPGILTASRDEVVEVELIYDDGTRQREFDRRFGPGLVRVISALRPYRG